MRRVSYWLLRHRGQHFLLVNFSKAWRHAWRGRYSGCPSSCQFRSPLLPSSCPAGHPRGCRLHLHCPPPKAQKAWGPGQRPVASWGPHPVEHVGAGQQHLQDSEYGGVLKPSLACRAAAIGRVLGCSWGCSTAMGSRALLRPLREATHWGCERQSGGAQRRPRGHLLSGASSWSVLTGLSSAPGRCRATLVCPSPARSPFHSADEALWPTPTPEPRGFSARTQQGPRSLVVRPAKGSDLMSLGFRRRLLTCCVWKHRAPTFPGPSVGGPTAPCGGNLQPGPQDSAVLCRAPQGYRMGLSW